MVDINTNDTDRNNYRIELFRGNTMILMNKLLKPRNVTYVGSIPNSSEDYINESNNLTQE